MYELLCLMQLISISTTIDCVDGYNKMNTEPLVLYSASYDQQQKSGLFTDTLTNFMNDRISNSQLLSDTEVMSNKSKISQFDYSLKGNFVIWSVVTAQNLHIYVTPMNKSYKSFINMTTEIYKTQTFHSFTFDWIHNLIYHVYNYEVHVANINRMDISIKILETEEYITSFNICPHKLYIFWSEYSGIFNGTHSDGSSIIMRSNQDGSNKKLLRSDGLGLVFWLRRDHDSGRLFWFDYQFNRLSSMDVNGKNFKIVYESVNMVLVDRFGGYNLLNHYIYYCCKEFNTTSKTICKIDVNHKNISESFHINDRELKVRIDFKFIDGCQQRVTDDRCLNSNCSHLCLPVNLTHYRCVCPVSTQVNSCIESIWKINSIEVNDEKSNVTESTIGTSFELPWYKFHIEWIVISSTLIVILLMAVTSYLIYYFRGQETNKNNTEKITNHNKLNTSDSKNCETTVYSKQEMPKQYAGVAQNSAQNSDYLEITSSNNLNENEIGYLAMKPTKTITESSEYI